MTTEQIQVVATRFGKGGFRYNVWNQAVSFKSLTYEQAHVVLAGMGLATPADAGLLMHQARSEVR